MMIGSGWIHRHIYIPALGVFCRDNISLPVVYLDVIKFCTFAKSIFQITRRNFVVNAHILLSVPWNSVDRQFGTVKGQFRPTPKVYRERFRSTLENLPESLTAIFKRIS
ncbi:hypothetical protein ABVK25_007692 [Lepraria finkii]|uniref:Uncharacterized protein n=1 Tax=Lepraria finkii TaxID=1340010 RepID=A0ABR4B2N2_9LECA